MTSPRMLAVGLTASVGLHAMGLLWVGLQRSPRFASAVPAELQLVQFEPPQPAPQPAPERPPQVKQQGVQARPTRLRAKVAAAAPAPEATGPVADAAPIFIPGPLRLGPGTMMAPQGKGPATGSPHPPTPGTPDRDAAVAAELKIPYPAEARRAGVEGTVRLRITVDADGRVTAVQILAGPGYGLDEAARDAIRNFRFTPAVRAGVPAATTVLYNYTFSLE